MSQVLKEKMYLTSNSQDVSLQKRIISFGLMVTEVCTTDWGKNKKVKSLEER